MTWALPRVGTAAVAQRQCGSAQYGVKALFFDVFGTLVDWRTGIAREAEAHLKPRGYALDWLAFVESVKLDRCLTIWVQEVPIPRGFFRCQ